MSAPHTDLEKQKKQHRTALFGMRAVVLWALVLLGLLALYVVFRGNEPDEGDEAAGATAPQVEATQ